MMLEKIHGGYKQMLSETIKMVRQRKFMSQEEFAKEIKVSPSTINRWETGKVKPNLSAMKKIITFCEKNNLPNDKIEQEWLNEKAED